MVCICRALLGQLHCEKDLLTPPRGRSAECTEYPVGAVRGIDSESKTVWNKVYSFLLKRETGRLS